MNLLRSVRVQVFFYCKNSAANCVMFDVENTKRRNINRDSRYEQSRKLMVKKPRKKNEAHTCDDIQV